MNLLNKKVVSTVLFLTAFFVLQLRAMDYGHMLMNIDVKIENQHQEFLSQQLYKAIGDKDQKKIVSLIEEGVDINKIAFVVIEYYYKEYATPLLFCIWKKNIDAFKTLIQYGANINKKVPGDRTPFNVAIEKMDYYEFAEILIEHGVNVDERNARGSLHIMSELIGCNEVVNIAIAKKIIKNGANINAMDHAYGSIIEAGKVIPLFTPLMLATIVAKKLMILFLITEGAKVTLKNNIGQTALDLAKKSLQYYSSSHDLYSYSIYRDIIYILLHHHNIYITHQNEYKKFDQHCDFKFNYKSNPLF